MYNIVSKFNELSVMYFLVRITSTTNTLGFLCGFVLLQLLYIIGVNKAQAYTKD